MFLLSNLWFCIGLGVVWGHGFDILAHASLLWLCSLLCESFFMSQGEIFANYTLWWWVNIRTYKEIQNLNTTHMTVHPVNKWANGWMESSWKEKTQMDNSYLKQCSMYSAMRAGENWKYFEVPPLPVRTAILKTNDSKCRWGHGERGTTECQLGEPLEAIVEVSQNLKIELPCEPAMILLNIYPTDCKLMCCRDIHTTMFIPLYSC